MKKTKIVATIGPASDNRDMIKQLYEEGVDVFRLNCSHGDHEYFTKIIKIIRSVSKEVAILLDTKGPEIRTGIIDEPIDLVEGDIVKIMNSKSPKGDNKTIHVDYMYLNELKKNDHLLIDDGLIEVRIRDDGTGRVLNNGRLGSKKSVSIRGHNVKLPFISEKDKRDIKYGVEQGVDFIAASFVRKPSDIEELRYEIKGSDIRIISKIEHPEAVKHIEEIVNLSDGIMVARGDLGVEISLEKVPRIQNRIIKMCNVIGKPVIVATQMLESMNVNPRPTRAEVSDVAQAILAGTDAVMLSGETAAGKYPLNAVRTMAKIAGEYDKRVKYFSTGMQNISDMQGKPIALFVTKAAYHASVALKTKAILTPTMSGFTARKVSRFKPKCNIIAITANMTVVRQLRLSWGVIPLYEDKKYIDLDRMIIDVVQKSLDKGLIDKNDTVVVTAGYRLGQKHGTNLLEIYQVDTLI